MIQAPKRLAPARLWRPAPRGGNLVICELCAHRCAIPEKSAGKCGVRLNQGSRLYSLVGDNLASVNLDPIEKKPLFHFLPGSAAFSIGTLGCNFSCGFCQNYAISQIRPEALPRLGKKAAPADIVRAALESEAASLAYTYNEPTVFFELMQDTATLAKEHGLANVMISNGFQSQACLEALRPLIQAANFDLKSFSDSFYRTRCGGRLKPVLDTLRRAVAYGWWVELTTLLIPGLNDSPAELRELAGFIASDLGKSVPWHISRFHPAHKMPDLPPTSRESLEAAWEIGKQAGLEYVYIGNLPGHRGESTLCPDCGSVVLERVGYHTTIRGRGDCPDCGREIAGIWREEG